MPLDNCELRSLECRFTKPVFVGDRLTVLVWDDRPAGCLNFQVRNKDDDAVVVVDDGCVEYGATRLPSKL